MWWRREKQPKVKHRVVLEISFDIQDGSLEAAAERVKKITDEYMPGVMFHLGPWHESKHREIKLLGVTRLDDSGDSQSP